MECEPVRMVSNGGDACAMGNETDKQNKFEAKHNRTNTRARDNPHRKNLNHIIDNKIEVDLPIHTQVGIVE